MDYNGIFFYKPFCLVVSPQIKMTSPKVLVLGHSFVRRLEQFVRDSTKPWINRRFNLNYPIETYFHGIGGRTVDGVLEHDVSEIQRYKPNIVIIEIGCNDLSDPRCSPYDLVSKINQLICVIRRVATDCFIIVSEILPRNNIPFRTPNYNRKVQEANYQLHRFCSQCSSVLFWSHGNLSERTPWVLKPDGVHLNSIGNRKLYISYQRALLRVFSTYNVRAVNSTVSVFHRHRARRRNPACQKL